MRKSKHFRKDVIIARIIAAFILVILIVIISSLVSALVKPLKDTAKNNPNSESEYGDGMSNNDKDPAVPGNATAVGDSENTEGTSEPEDTEQHVITTANVKFRSGPGTDYEVIGYINKDVEVVLLEEVHGWYKVSYNGQEGYISADYSSKVE